jgi:hypothetical protein
MAKTPERTGPIDLEFRQWNVDSHPDDVIDYMVVMGESPRVTIDFVGTLGVGLEKIRIDSTGYPPKDLADLFDTLARTLRGEPHKVYGETSTRD